MNKYVGVNRLKEIFENIKSLFISAKSYVDKNVGKGSYNLIPFPYNHSGHNNWNGVDYYFQKDGTVIADGTATADSNVVIITRTLATNFRLEDGKRYILLNDDQNDTTRTCYIGLNGTTSSGDSVIVARTYNSDKTFVYSENDFSYMGIFLHVHKDVTVSNYVFKPMIVEIDENGNYPTRYMRGSVKSNLALTSISDRVEKRIGYNLIPYPYHDGMLKTNNGVAYTVNNDGSVYAKGTATATSQFTLSNELELDSTKTYVLSGDYDDDTKYATHSDILFNAETSSGTSYWNTGKDKVAIFTGVSKAVNLRIRIASGVTIDQTFKPMIVEVNDDGSYLTEYKKYAKSNLELTDFIGYDSTIGDRTLTEAINYVCGKIDDQTMDIRNLSTEVYNKAGKEELWDAESRIDEKKVDKEDGKALSSNDYTNEDKALVDTIEGKVDNTADGAIGLITKLSTSTAEMNDNTYMIVGGTTYIRKKITVLWDYIKSKITDDTDILKTTNVDTAMSSSSTNPVQNKVVNTALGNKVDKVSGKGLSTNDFTAALKTKLDAVGTYTGVTILDDKTVASGSSVNMTDGVELDVGTYIVNANIRISKVPIMMITYPGGVEVPDYGNRTIWASFTTTSGGSTQHAVAVPSDTDTNNLNFSYILNLSSKATYYLNAGQKNGAGKSVKFTKSGSYCRIIRVK